MSVVTGANGFLGAYVTSTLLLKGDSVKALIRHGSSKKEFETISSLMLKGQEHLLNNLTWIDADVTDVLSLDAAFVGEDHVYHTAAIVAFKGNSQHMSKVNVEGTANIVNACLKAGIKKLIYVSSTAALGRTDSKAPINESTTWKDDNNNTAYAVTKHLAELEVWRGVEEGLDVLIVNPGIILGAGNWEKGSARLFYNVFKGFKFVTEGINGFVDVRDVAKFMVEKGNSDIRNKRFLLVSENMTYKQLFDQIAKGLQVKAPSILVKSIHVKGFGWLVKLYGWLNPSSSISYETLKTSVKEHTYQNQAALNTGFEFTPVSVTIERTCKEFLQFYK